MLGTLRAKVVVVETTNKGQIGVSAAADSRQNGRVRRAAEYPMTVRVVFVFKRSAMICAPSTFKSLPPKLRRKAQSECQRLLTVGI